MHCSKTRSFRLCLFALAAALAAPVAGHAQTAFPGPASKSWSIGSAAAPGAADAAKPHDAEPATAGACDDACPSQRRWTARVIPYMWLTEMHGDLTLRGETADVDVSMGTTWDLLFNNLNFAALGQIEAYNGRFGVIFNALYLDVDVGGEVRRLTFDADFTQTILDTAFTYELAGVDQHLPCGSRLDLLAGARYNSLSAGVTITGPLGRTVSVNGSEDWLDPIVGARLRVPLTETATFSFRGDVGGFGWGNASDFTWNIELMVELRRSERMSLIAGYRWLDIDRDDSPRFGYDVNISGPVMGIVFDF